MTKKATDKTVYSADSYAKTLYASRLESYNISLKNINTLKYA